MTEVRLPSNAVNNPLDSAHIKIKTEPPDVDDFYHPPEYHQEFPTTLSVKTEMKLEPDEIQVTLVDLPVCEQQCTDPLSLKEENLEESYTPENEFFPIKPCVVLLDKSEVTKYLDAQTQKQKFPTQKKIKIWSLPIKSEFASPSDESQDYFVVRDFSHLEDGHEKDPNQTTKGGKLKKRDEKTQHHSIDTSNSFKCPQCSKIIKNKCHLQRHILNVHKKIRNHKCKLCDKMFFASSDLNQHVAVVHSNTKKNNFNELCELCNKTFSKKYINSHIRDVHNVNNLYYCDNCKGKNFKSKDMLRRHTLQVHLKVKNHKCPVCNRTFFALNKMKRHLTVVHKKVKAFSCIYCKKSFGRKFCLKKHVEKCPKKEEF